jgi:hypothetical protein
MAIAAPHLAVGRGINQREARISMDDDKEDVTAWLLDQLEEVHERARDILAKHMADLRRRSSASLESLSHVRI